LKKLEEDSVKNLFRKFVADACNQDEVLQVVAMLQKEEYLNWYGDVMDETAQRMDLEEQPLAREVVEARFEVLELRISFPSIHKTEAGPAWFTRTWAAASIAVILAITGLIWYVLAGQQVTQRTAFGETKVINLPDGSQVSLNGHSQVTFASNWDGDESRQVELRGEAYFKVLKTTDHRKFTVVMPGTGQIDVLGTEFNVNHREGLSSVMLRSGSIRLKLEQDIGKREIVMKPGELVDISATDMVRRQVDPARFDSWRQKVLVFDNTSLREIALILKQTYDLDLEVNDPALWKKEISGTAPIQDMDVFINALSGSFNLQISRKGNRILVSDIR
jgi:transmembrane sensor